MSDRCAEEGCLNKKDNCKYCPKHKPKPYYRNATQLVEFGDLDVEMSVAEEMETKYEEVHS